MSYLEIFQQEVVNFHKTCERRKLRRAEVLFDVVYGGAEFLPSCGDKAATSTAVTGGSVVDAIVETKKRIHEAKQKAGKGQSCESSAGGLDVADLVAEVETLKKESKVVKAELADLRSLVRQLQSQLTRSTETKEKESAAVGGAVGDAKSVSDDEDDIDWSESEEDEEKERIREARVKAYEEKKSKKPAAIAKSSVLLDVKPWCDETDMKEMEVNVRTVEMDGLVWGASKLIPLAYGIKKLQVMCVVEDEKVSVDELVERIQDDFSELVQSVDIVAFNKI